MFNLFFSTKVDNLGELLVWKFKIFDKIFLLLKGESLYIHCFNLLHFIDND